MFLKSGQKQSQLEHRGAKLRRKDISSICPYLSSQRSFTLEIFYGGSPRDLGLRKWAFGLARCLP